jgi:hypothetical protein
MAKPDGRIEKGQRLSTAISARAWNRAQDAADIVLGVRPGVEAGGFGGYQKPYHWVYVYNESNSEDDAIPRWGPVWFNQQQRHNFYNSFVDSDENRRFFEDVPVLVGTRPEYQFGTNDSQQPIAYGVAVEPIGRNAIGRVAVSGVVQCKLNVSNESDCYANIVGATKEEFSTNTSEGSLILHKDNGTGTGKWGLIRLGHERTARRATITTTWQFGARRELTDQDGRTFSAFNAIHTLTVPISFVSTVGFTVLAERIVYCAFVAGDWQLISWQSGLATPASLPQTTAIVPV